MAPYWDNEERSFWLADPTGPGLRNALRSTLHRLWLMENVHVDPDVVYFRTRFNLLSPEEMRLQEALAHFTGFKATSDPPSWLLPEEKGRLRAFLAREVPVRRLGPYRFRVGEEEVDYAPFYKRLHRKKDGRELFLYGLMPLEGPPLPEDAEPFRPAPHLRYHPLRGEWVVYAAHRQGRTFLPPRSTAPCARAGKGASPRRSPSPPFRWPSLRTASPPSWRKPLPSRGASRARGEGLGAVRGGGLHPRPHGKPRHPHGGGKAPFGLGVAGPVRGPLRPSRGALRHAL